MRNKSIEQGPMAALIKILVELPSRMGRVFAGLRMKSRAHAESTLKIEEKLSLGPKKMLYLVNCKGRDLLIAAGADSIISVMELSPAGPVDLADTNPAKPLPRLQKRARLS
jgi:hypothetical protein